MFWLFVTQWTVAHQVPLSMGILQGRILEWVADPFSRGISQPRNHTGVSCTASGFFTRWATREAQLKGIHKYITNSREVFRTKALGRSQHCSCGASLSCSFHSLLFHIWVIITGHPEISWPGIQLLASNRNVPPVYSKLSRWDHNSLTWYVSSCWKNNVPDVLGEGHWTPSSDIPQPVLGSDARFRQNSGHKLGSRNWAKGSAHNDTY